MNTIASPEVSSQFVDHRAITWARDLRAFPDGKPLKPRHKAVLLSLASRCDQKHQCFPSRETIGGDSAMCGRTVFTVVRELESGGLILLTESSGRRSHIYTLCVDRPANIRSTPVGQVLDKCVANANQLIETRQRVAWYKEYFGNIPEIKTPNQASSCHVGGNCRPFADGSADDLPQPGNSDTPTRQLSTSTRQLSGSTRQAVASEVGSIEVKREVVSVADAPAHSKTSQSNKSEIQSLPEDQLLDCSALNTRSASLAKIQAAKTAVGSSPQTKEPSEVARQA